MLRVDGISSTRTTSDPSRRSFAPEVVLVGGGLLLNFAWDPLQTSLYVEVGQPWRDLLATQAHCTSVNRFVPPLTWPC